jgi:hypothetical protein
MLFLKKLFSSLPGMTSAAGSTAPEFPLELEEKFCAIHGRAPVDRHLDILCGHYRVGEERFVDLYRRCLQATGTVLTPMSVFHRFQTRLNLVNYFLATLALPGARTECGVYRGATALLLAHVWRSRRPGYRGEDLYLIDSFAGTSANTERDLIPVRGEDGAPRMAPFFTPGKTDIDAGLVRGFFGDFPQAAICAGWIPQVFATLPERSWAFVHLDLTLYEPTLAALEYFHPRLDPGGVIFCDGSPFCPGVEQAVDDFCRRRDLAYVRLGYRELIILKAD